MRTTLTLLQVEQMIVTCRMRQLREQYHGTATAAATYEAATNRWLELWRPAKADRTVTI